ncbi:TIGR00282 family metallophosphoesterase [Ureaplasma ceti]|uniref:TIGR00282 family metallophosphoesterase n=1 Tax=Ureaplasma ceti TaxID=3119530 RepID=A0ABP9U625_9BACT
MKILFIGDIFASTGRRAVQEILPNLKKSEHIDFVIANAENTTNCKGLSIEHYKDLMSYGVDFFTMGNHTWSRKEIYEILDTQPNIIRPFNVNTLHDFGKHGIGSRVVEVQGKTIRITNLLGSSVHFNEIQTNPFFVLQSLVRNEKKTDFHIVDFHAETTAEKSALFYEFKGKVDAILGTHTHIQTADNRIRKHTAFITDVGSTGPADGIIGGKAELMVNRFKGINERIILEEQGGYFQFCAVILDLDTENNVVTDIKRVYIYEEDLINQNKVN